MKFQSTQIKGDGIGSRKVVPTINLLVPGDNFALPEGVYAAYATLRNKKYRAALHYGSRPTFKRSENSLELHILEEVVIFELNKDEYIEVQIVEKIRDVKLFESAEDLKKQIAMDITKILNILGPQSG